MFFNQRLEIYKQGSSFNLDVGGYNATGVFGKVNFFTIKRQNFRLLVLDSFAFTQTGLARSLKMFRIAQAKLTPPKGLGSRKLRSKEFENYARQDSIAQYHLGLKILEYHNKYKVRPCVSLPQFASRVFRHYFIQKNEVIKFPPIPCVRGAELSYHGGKNHYHFDKPRVVENVYEADIISAYPYAMSKLPQFSEGKYSRVYSYTPGFCAVYRVTGMVTGGYPLIFDHSFNPVMGPFENLWITGFELELAMKSPYIQIECKEGWIWEPSPSYKHSPLAEYVKHFFELKQKTPKTDPNYHFYKIAMNALYGKFQQAIEQRETVIVDDGKGNPVAMGLNGRFDSALGCIVSVNSQFKAGGLYNPFIATQITAFVRAMLYRYEVQYEALHSATDAIKTTHKIKSSSGLGGFKIEAFGRCYFFRNKLYLHFSKSFEYCSHNKREDGSPKSKDELQKMIWDKGQHLCKYGLHGYKGTVEDLYANRERLLSGGFYEYEYDHMVGLREGLRRRETVCDMTRRKERLSLTKNSLSVINRVEVQGGTLPANAVRPAPITAPDFSAGVRKGPADFKEVSIN